MVKTCNRCGVEKELHEFHKNPQGKYGRASTCKVCRSKYEKGRYEGKFEEIREKKNLRSYGITEAEYVEMFTAQEGKCAICNQPAETRLHIDHDHKTGKVRGLLCTHCNKGIGCLRDDVTILRNAIKYLQ